MDRMVSALRVGVTLTAMVLLAACGGGGGGGGSTRALGTGTTGGLNPPGNTTPGGSVSSTYTPGIFQASSTYANQCSSEVDQKQFLRSWTNELYLWFDEVPERDPQQPLGIDEYFGLLKTPGLTPSGTPKDRFHFAMDTAEYQQLSQGGIEVGYGAQLVTLASLPPRKVVVAYVQAATPADAQAIPRGAEIIGADGYSVVDENSGAGVDAINAALFPATAGESHTFRIRQNGVDRMVTLTSQNVTFNPAPIAQVLPGGDQVGYLLFNEHIATSEAALISAINTLKNGAITDLVLDLRYNTGGYLDIASELGYMIGGSNVVGKTFERMVFSSKHPSTNPVTHDPLAPTPFHSTSLGFPGTAEGTTLPTLNLSRVYVLTGTNTCSASEAVINSLRGANVTVYQIGSTTCGKPYGFYPKDNCGTTYFSIQFKGVNAASFGDYPDGFSPSNSTGVKGVELPGCAVADDFAHELGDVNEARLAAALAFRAGNNSQSSCPTPPVSSATGVSQKPGQLSATGDGILHRSPALQNRIMRTP